MRFGLFFGLLFSGFGFGFRHTTSLLQQAVAKAPLFRCNAVPDSRVIMGKDLGLNVADCLARVRNQDQDAACSLVEYLYPTVIRIVRGNLPRRAAEEDLAQDIFVKMFEKLDQFQGKVPFEHWVSRIAVNHCLNAIRAQKVRPEWPSASPRSSHCLARAGGDIAGESEPRGSYFDSHAGNG
jgi:hypothetical protein